MNRRVFLKAGGFALISVGVSPGFLLRSLGAAEKELRRPKVLVCLFQRGAVDGLNMVIPFAEDLYHAGRPNIGIGRPRKGDSTTAIDLDGFFGLHPAMGSLMESWNDKTLAIVHAVGSPHPTRSHFDAQDFMESATPGRKATPDGWLNRALRHSSPHSEKETFRGVALASTPPRSLMGRVPTLSMESLDRFGVGGRRRESSTSRTIHDDFQRLYGEAGDALLAPPGEDSLHAAETLRSLDPARYRPAAGANYPGGALGRSLRQIAQLIKADVGVEIAFAESGGWDHHANEGNHTGVLARMLGSFSQAVHAFRTDLGARYQDVVILTMSEFGRTVRENGSRGTDHGHANAMLLLGGGVEGGQVYGEWPGLAQESLFDGRDLEVTTDFRSVFAEVASRHLGVRDLKSVLPGFRTQPLEILERG